MSYIKQASITKLAALPFGKGQIGRREAFHDGLAEMEYAEHLAAHTRSLTQANLADCIDGRRTLRFAESVDGPIISERIVPQLPGGNFLAAVKATIAAGAQAVNGAKNMQAAYEIVAEVLVAVGEEDAAHADCGAEKKAELSVASRIDEEALQASFRLLLGDGHRISSHVTAIQDHKQKLLNDGFYASWDPDWHADYVKSKFPENYAYLEVDHDDETNGHHEAGLYVITEAGKGFAKNAFIDTTRRQAFAVSVPKMRQLANILGGSSEERQRIFLAFIDDALHVSNALASEGLPVFSDSHNQ